MFELAARVTDAELVILQAMWREGGAMTIAQIRAALPGCNPDTTKTLLRRLCAKGAVRQEKREVFYYTPLVSQSELTHYRTQRLIDQLYGGSAKALVAAMVQHEQLRREDMDELQRMFQVLWRMGGR